MSEIKLPKSVLGDGESMLETYVHPLNRDSRKSGDDPVDVEKTVNNQLWRMYEAHSMTINKLKRPQARPGNIPIREPE